MKLLEDCKVVPSATPLEFSLPLTFFDKIWLYANPTSRLFFYEFSKQEPESTPILISRLKCSLSHTLKHYVPLAGKLSWPQDSESPVVQYRTGDGVALSIEETNADFHSLSGNEFRKSAELRSFMPDFPTTEIQAPVITLKINLFPNTGFCIGYAAHHGVLDGKSISLFIHSWAYICKNGDNAVLPPELTPFFDRTFVKHQEELERVCPVYFNKRTAPDCKDLAVYDMTPPPDILLGTFVLTRENIVTMKKSVLAYFENKNKLESTTRVSTFMVTTALVMVCLIKAKQISTEKCSVGINVDVRSRLDPPLPLNYFGNCVMWCTPMGNPEEYLLENGVFVAVELIIESLATLNEGLVKLGENVIDMIPTMYKTFAGFIGVAGSPHFEMYKVDFGWGKPKKVELITIDKGLVIYLSDNRDEIGGIEIGVALNQDEAEAFTSFFNSQIHAF